MNIRRNGLLLLIALAGVHAADNDKNRFSPKPAASYPFHQTNGKVTIAAVPYETDEQARTAFDKRNPYKYGVLPVLLVIQNDSDTALRLDGMRAEYTTPDGSRIEATPAADVRFISGPQKPNMAPNPLPIPRRAKKNPLDMWEIEGRAFSAKMLPAGEAAHGFVYFQTRHSPNSRIYITGLSEASTGKELFFFDIPFTADKR